MNPCFHVRMKTPRDHKRTCFKNQTILKRQLILHINSLREETKESDESDREYITSITDRREVVHAIKNESYPKEIYTEMVVAKKPVKFQVDSGTSVNVIPATLAPDEPLKRTTKMLRYHFSKPEEQSIASIYSDIRSLVNDYKIT